MTDLIKHLKNIGSPKILVIGDLILDKYVSGKVDRISPEAPIQVLNTSREEYRLGGAANVAHNLVALGARVTLLGIVGSDDTGRRLKRLIQHSQINASGVMLAADRPTSVKTRFIAHNQQVLRVDQEKSSPINAQLEKRFVAYLKKHLQDQEMVLVSDYHKGLLTPVLLKALITLARRAKIKVIIDPKGRDYKRYRGATALTPNKIETEFVSGINISDKSSRRQAARNLIKTLGLKFIVITLGEDGIYLQDRTGHGFYDPAQPLAVYDVTGAGDTVLATLGLGLASGLDYQDAIHLANLAAGLVVSKLGTTTVTRAELMTRYTPSWRNKIKTPSSLRNWLVKHRGQVDKGKQKVVFTNGCFDLLHPGHLATLEFAKAQGNLLIIGLNSDRSVHLIKGRKRPIFNQEDRARGLSALSCVDYVTIFNEPTPEKLIRQLKPDILVKGMDWRGKEVVGEKFIRSYGGQVVFAPLVKGFSTTKLLSKLRI